MLFEFSEKKESIHDKQCICFHYGDEFRLLLTPWWKKMISLSDACVDLSSVCTGVDIY